MPCLGLKRKFRGEPSMPETLGSVPSTAKQTNALVGEDALPSDWALFVPIKHRLLWEMMLPSTVTVYKSRRTWFPSGFKAVMFVSPRKFYVFLRHLFQASWTLT